jgi:polyphosphate kinase 2 (PPK2 family)
MIYSIPHREEGCKSHRKRFLERIVEPDKSCKFTTTNIRERKCGKRYIKVCEYCFHRTITHSAPWYIIPADDKQNARLIVFNIVLDVRGELRMTYPKSTDKRRVEFHSIKKLLA